MQNMQDMQPQAESPGVLRECLCLDREILGSLRLELSTRLDSEGFDGLHRMRAESCFLLVEMAFPQKLEARAREILREFAKEFHHEPPVPPEWAAALGYSSEIQEHLEILAKLSGSSPVPAMLSRFCAAWLSRNLEIPMYLRGAHAVPDEISWVGLSVLCERVSIPDLPETICLCPVPEEGSFREEWQLLGLEDYQDATAVRDWLLEGLREIPASLGPSPLPFPVESLGELGCLAIRELAAGSGDPGRMVERLGMPAGPDTRLCDALRELCGTAGRNFSARVLLSVLLADGLNPGDSDPDLERAARIAGKVCERI